MNINKSDGLDSIQARVSLELRWGSQRIVVAGNLHAF